MINVLEMFGEPITYGGQESVVYNIISTLNLNSKFCIDVYTPYYVDNSEIIDIVNKNSGQIYSMNINKKNSKKSWAAIFATLTFLSNTNKKYDVVHIHTGSLFVMCYYSILAKKKFDAKIILHAHCTGDNYSFIHKIVKHILCKITKRYVDYYIGCSKEALDWKWTQDIVKKAIIVKNGIDVGKFVFDKNKRANLRNVFNLNDKIIIGNVSRFTYEKNHQFMVDILKELLKYNNRYFMVLIGDGIEKDKIIKYSKNMNVYDKILFISNTSSVCDYYNIFDVFILPSIYEGFGIVSIEAQINQLPTFLSDTITKECNISNRLLFLPINDKKIWVKKIIGCKLDRLAIVDYDKFDKNKTYKVFNNLYKFNI